MTKVIINGNDYSDDGTGSRDMNYGGWRKWLMPMLSDVIAVVYNIDSVAANAAGSAAMAASAAAGWTATSTTSLTVGTGTKNLALEAGKQFVPGTFVLLMRTGAVDTTYMMCRVTSYNKLTGAAALESSFALGAGTYTDWTVTLSGKQGADVTVPTQTGHAGKMLETNGTSTSWQFPMETHFQEFNTSGTWTKPPRAKWVMVDLVGAGGSGAITVNNNSLSGGGAGGRWRFFLFRASDLPATVTVTIGAGAPSVTRVGTGTTANSQMDGVAGGDTTFGSYLVAKGGAGGKAGEYTYPILGIDSTKGGGVGGSAGGSSGLPPGEPEEAGAGGAGARPASATSDVAAGAGQSPGGGGGAVQYQTTTYVGTMTSGPGAKGRARIWAW